MNVLSYTPCAPLPLVLAFTEADRLLDFPTQRLTDLEKKLVSFVDVSKSTEILIFMHSVLQEQKL
jgi:hypothetical protein